LSKYLLIGLIFPVNFFRPEIYNPTL
jgi:hypothetical protein